MNFIYDYFPIICFFIAYKIAGIYWATVIAIIASGLQVGVYWFRHKKFEKVHLVTLVLIIVLGGMTIIFHKPIFIQWKPSIVYLLFTILLIGCRHVGSKKSLLIHLLGKKVQLPEKVWWHLNYAWAIFFFLLGFLNIYVVYNYSLDSWVYFKLFGTLGLTLLFVVFQGIYIYRHLE